MLTLDRYITGHCNRAIAVVVLSLLSLISLFALFEELDGAEPGYTFTHALSFVIKTLPRRLDEVLIYSLFLGYLIALGRLAETNELTVARTAGMSPTRLMLAMAPSMILWLTISVAVAEYIAPASERQAEVEKMQASEGGQRSSIEIRGGLWLKHDNLFMRVSAIDEAGRLWGISQYWLDERHQLVTTVRAEAGQFDAVAQHWEFTNGARTELGQQGNKQDFERWIWDNPMSPELLASQAFLEPNKMSMLALYRQIQFARTQNLGVSEYEIAFWTRVLKPISYIGLTLFALSVVLGPLRQVSMGMRLTFGTFAGLGFKYLQDLFAPAAIVFNIPALIAILIPIALYWMIAWRLIRRNA